MTVICGSSEIVLRSDTLEYRLTTDGMTRSLVTRTGIDFVPGPFTDAWPFARIAFEETTASGTRVRVLPSRRISCAPDPGGDPDSGLLTVGFGRLDVEVAIYVQTFPTHILFELRAIRGTPTGDPEADLKRVEFARIKVGADRHEEDIGSVFRGALVLTELSLEPRTEVHCQPPPGACDEAIIELHAAGHAHPAMGLVGRRVALLLCGRDEWLDIVEGTERRHGLPHPTIDGVWSKRHPDIRRSYLLIDITEANADRVIDWAIRGRFTHIVVYRGVWSASTGRYPINGDNFPGSSDADRLASLANVVAKVHSAGLKFGLHTLSVSISRRDPFASSTDRAFDADGEPITFDDFFLPDLAGELIDTIAQRVAEVYSTIKADFLYLDSLAGPGVLLPGQINRRDWFTSALLAERFFRAVQATGRDVLIETSTGNPGNYQWHVNARGVSTDFAVLDPEAYMDHLKIGMFGESYKNIFLPQELGWIGLISRAPTGESKKIFHPSTTLGEMEYQLNRSLGHGLPIGLETHLEDLEGPAAPLRRFRNHRARLIFDMIGRYEKLRLTGFFDEATLEGLKRPDTEFRRAYGISKDQHHLQPDPARGFRLRRRAFFDHLARPEDTAWPVFNPFPDQPARVKITALPTPLSYDDDRVENLVLADFGAPFAFRVEAGEGTQLRVEDEGFFVADYAPSCGGTEGRGWCRLEISLSRRDLSENKVIAVPVLGDGRGQVVSIQLVDAKGNYREHQFTVDFDDLRLRQMELPSTGELYQFPWGSLSPRGGFAFGAMKKPFRPFQYDKVERLAIVIKNLAPGTSRVQLLPIKALRQRFRLLVEPAVDIAGSTVTFPTTLRPRRRIGRGVEAYVFEPWEYLVFNGRRFRKFDGNHRLIEEGTPRGDFPILRGGPNTVRFSARRKRRDGTRALVRLRAQER